MSTTNPARLAAENELDRRILHYIAQKRIESLIERGLIRLQEIPEEGRPRGLDLTDKGWRVLFGGA